jgi:hypothetical protein
MAAGRVVLSLLLAIAAALALLRVFPQLPFGRRLVLETEMTAGAGYASAPERDRRWLGQRGTAASPLRPAGLAVLIPVANARNPHSYVGATTTNQRFWAVLDNSPTVSVLTRFGSAGLIISSLTPCNRSLRAPLRGGVDYPRSTLAKDGPW